MTSVITSCLRTTASQLLHRVPISAWRELFPKDALGLCYHLVSDANVPHVRHYPILNIADFEADLAYLLNDFRFISYQQLAERRESGGAVRDNSIVLTFDDGFAECADVVAPVLLRHGVDCIFFVITDLIDNTRVFRETEASLCIEAVLRSPIELIEEIVGEIGLDRHLRPPPIRTLFDSTRFPLNIAGLDGQPDRRLRPLLHWLLTVGASDIKMMRRLSTRLDLDPESYVRTVKPYLTTRQIRDLQAAGFTIGAHGRSHRLLQDLPRTEAEDEIVGSCHVIRDLTGQKTVPFAFPYFGGGIDRTWLARLREEHDFIGMFFDTGGLREDELFVVQRVFGERVGVDHTMDAILRRAWARRPAWHRGG